MKTKGIEKVMEVLIKNKVNFEVRYDDREEDGDMYIEIADIGGHIHDNSFEGKPNEVVFYYSNTCATVDINDKNFEKVVLGYTGSDGYEDSSFEAIAELYHLKIG